MNIGIILWSQTGNTYLVAKKIKETLDAAGHSVNIERIKIAGEFKPGKKDIQFVTLPGVAHYDGIVFGAPVQAISLSRVMTQHLKQLPSLKNKKVALYVTKQLRFNWTGGNQAINKMKKNLHIQGWNNIWIRHSNLEQSRPGTDDRRDRRTHTQVVLSLQAQGQR